MSTEPWFVYIVECSDKSLYIGISNNVSLRITKHNAGKGAKYTQGRLPVQLLCQEKQANKSMARKREIQLKGWTRNKKLWLINLKNTSNPHPDLHLEIKDGSCNY